MSDVVVTVPKDFGLREWIAEGDAAGEPYTGKEWGFRCGGPAPTIAPGERVYIVCNNRLRGYAPLVRLAWYGNRGSFVRGGGAVAVTLGFPIVGFRGWKYRWWDRAEERPFPDWRTP